MRIENKKKEISIVLAPDETLVFFEWLTRYNEKSENDFFEDNSEEIVLNNLEAILEKNSELIFSENYKKELSNARESVSDAFHDN